MIFRSKIDTWLVLAILPALFLCIFGAFYTIKNNGPWFISIGASFLGILLPGWTFLATYYKITEQELIVKSGPFRWNIPIESIKNIEPDNSPISSPALSLDRLRIEYVTDGNKSLLISPADKEGFRAAIKAARIKNSNK